MPVRPSNDYMVWVAAVATPTAFSLLGGQQDLSWESQGQTIDASHKTSGTFALKLRGLRDITTTVQIVTDLPDTGYTIIETAHKSASGQVVVQIRKDGAAGTAPDDVVFQAQMFVASMSISGPLNGVVSGNITFELAGVPAIDMLLS